MLYLQGSQRLTTKKKHEEKTELHSTKECAHVHFATWPKTFCFLAYVNCFVRLQKKQSTCFSSNSQETCKHVRTKMVPNVWLKKLSIPTQRKYLENEVQQEAKC